MMYMIEQLPMTVYAINRLQAFGGDKPEDLRCRDCDERRAVNLAELLPEDLKGIYKKKVY